MTPDEIRRSWDDDDTPRSVFPEPLAERLTRENKELRAENGRLRDELGQIADVLAARNREIAAAEARLDALVADLRGLADEWDRGGRALLAGGGGVGVMSMVDASRRIGAVLDKHAGEQP
jgi:hypothetical protein